MITTKVDAHTCIIIAVISTYVLMRYLTKLFGYNEIITENIVQGKP